MKLERARHGPGMELEWTGNGPENDRVRTGNGPGNDRVRTGNRGFEMSMSQNCQNLPTRLTGQAACA